MRNDIELSEALRQLGQDSTVSRPSDLRALACLMPSNRPTYWVDAAELLVRLSGGRGLPRVDAYDFGVLADFAVSPPRQRSAAPCLVVARHRSGREVIMRSDNGAIYEGEERRGASLRIFLERLAAEIYPRRAEVGFAIHPRLHDARRIANKLRITQNDAASSPYDECWADERWFVTQTRVAARRFEDVDLILDAALACDAEIGLHDGRAEALLVEADQPVVERARYHRRAGIAELSIRTTSDQRIEQSLHYGEVGTEWSEWGDGELLVQRKRPMTELFSPVPELQEYLHARRLQRLPQLQRSDVDLERVYGVDIWPVLRALERDYGGLIAEDALGAWASFHVEPLVAPGYVAETVKPEERVRTAHGEPVYEVGTVKLDRRLCVDEKGRFYITYPSGYDLEAGGDDLESTFLRLALDWKYERWRTDACLGGFLAPQDAARLIEALRGTIDHKLDTFGHAYYQGAGFVLRHPKPVVGQHSFFHLVATSTKRFCDIVRPLTKGGQPIRVEHDNLSFPTDEEIGACAKAGVLLSDM